MGQRKFLSGNHAVAHAVKLAEPEVVAVYPITPQTAIVEKISDFIANHELDAEFIKVESEHTALAACYGAACAGCRTFTATSSQGLAYMSEMLPFVSGNRFPVVMAVVNRGMAAPWTIWGDHQDTVSQRDTGWIQLYAENAQEAFDTCLQAFSLAEDPEILLPVMVCLDGFVLSHTDEIVEVPEAHEVRSFLPQYRPRYALDFDRPATFCIGAPPDVYAEFKYHQQVAMGTALKKIDQVAARFEAHFGRNHGGLIKGYQCEGAEYILVTMGSVTGTARVVMNRLRSRGKKVGVLKVRSFRPLPSGELADALGSAMAVGVLDRNCSYGYQGALCTEIKAALFGRAGGPVVVNYVAGLGGRDIRISDIESMFEHLEEAANQPGLAKTVNFIGLR